MQGEVKAYSIAHGWDPISSHQCDSKWGDYNYQLLSYIKDQNYSPQQLEDVLNLVQLEDSHWDWLQKSYLYRSDEYDWFYLIVDNEVQAACLIYHPKKSAIDSDNIFYVEFVAVAPWNRTNLMKARRFKGLASILMKHSVNYSINQLRLRPGFSLHSLPLAEGFYKKIGMNEFPEFNKNELTYFEMPEAGALTLVGGA